MGETADHGYVARHNLEIGRALGIVSLLVSVGFGAGLMLSTGTRGISAILTVVTIAGGTFTLMLQGIGVALQAFTPTSLWRAQEDAWRAEMGLAPLAADEVAEKAGGRPALLAVLAIIVGLALSLGPALA